LLLVYMGYWPVVKRVVKDSDIVLFVLDARMPELSYNMQLEKMLKMYRREFVKVFTKIDLVSNSELDRLRKKYRGDYFVSGVKNIGMSKLKEGLMIMAKRGGVKEPFIGVVGYPNVGKSAIINALAKRAKAKVSGRAGTTKGIQWVNAGSLRILDSPGVVPFEDNEVGLGLLGAKNVEKMKRLDKVTFAIIDRFLESDVSRLEELYSFKTDKGDDAKVHCEGCGTLDIQMSKKKQKRPLDAYDVLLKIGLAKGFLIKGGKVDERRAMEKIVRDWQSGVLRL